MLGHGLLSALWAAGANSTSATRSGAHSNPRRRGPQCRSAHLVVNHHSTNQDIMQQPTALIQKADQEDERGKGRDPYPEQYSVHGAENEISRSAVPDPHANRCRSVTAKADAIVKQRPDHGRGTQQPIERPAQPQSEEPDNKNESGYQHDRN